MPREQVWTLPAGSGGLVARYSIGWAIQEIFAWQRVFLRHNIYIFIRARHLQTSRLGEMLRFMMHFRLGMFEMSSGISAES